ncbi:BON domain-containing protein [Phenylobacterium sp.]|uniref:BON domain-containing protein n=1 Tax=Phenylobacterium sp. TaxID=1871053 RepID=UPI0027378536|nr:BON domain-containing protein [Phenylobacterium sp.]MDP3868704.1 BON domain-containing protein [Phenylobacterium sp.]
MAGRFEDDREWRERDAEFSRGYPGEDQPLDRYRGPEDRSFQRGPRGPVFGERESGASYSDPRAARDGSAGGGPRYASPIRGADRTYDRGPRGHTEAERNQAYRAAYGPQSEPRGAYERYRSYEAGDGDEARFYRDREDRDEDTGHSRNFLDRAADTVASWFSDRRPDFQRPVHRGLGPQGYKRSDERITEEVHERLTEDAWLDASNITLAVSDGEVTLSGSVTEREAKHRAERLVEDIGGVTHVQNNLRVSRPGDAK